jgi:hypothetical protein
MREPANKSLLTDVSGFRFHPCTIIASILLPEFREKALSHAPCLDTGHKRMRTSTLMVRSVATPRVSNHEASKEQQ